jgi:hypothetical protein
MLDCRFREAAMSKLARVRLLWASIAVCCASACGGGGEGNAAIANAPAAAPPPASSAGSAQAFALMDSGDGAAAFNTYLALGSVDGVAVRTSWQALEPARGSYDWSVVDAAASAAASHGKKFALHVLSSVYAPAPAWLVSEGTKTYSYQVPGGPAVTDPLPWDSTYIAEWAVFMSAMSAHLQATGGVARLHYVSVSAPVPEMSLPGCANGVMGSSTVTYDRALYRSAWKSTIAAIHSAFPGVAKLLPVPIAAICRPDSDGPALYAELLDGALGLEPQGFAFYATDLNALGSTRLKGIASQLDRAPVAVQFIGSASQDPALRMQGTLQSAVCNGLRIYGAAIFEVYKADISSADAAIQAGIAAIHAPRSCT